MRGNKGRYFDRERERERERWEGEEMEMILWERVYILRVLDRI